MKKIKIPEKKRTIEYVVKKSRFIATAEPLMHQDEVKKRIKEIREEYPGCSHVVHAFFAKDDRSISGLSDDGEPHGTSGRPIYEVLKGSGLTDILLTVVRYFGGTKLGTGGLVSAYGQSAKNVLEELTVIEKIYTVKIRVHLNYKIYESVKKLLIEDGAVNIEEDFSTEILLTADIPREYQLEIENKIRDISRGEAIPEILEEGIN
jgi:uncharacterized YigZ family protein